MKRITIFCSLIVFAFTGEAHVSQIHFEKITLQRLIDMSPVIVHVRRFTAATVTRKFKTPACSEPYEYGETRYAILDILRGPRNLARNGEITVTGFNPVSLRLHVDYYARGLSRSPVFPGYETEGPQKPVSDDECILFLKPVVFVQRDSTGRLTVEVNAFGPACWNARETADRKKDILSMLKAQTASESIDITVGIYRDLTVDEETGLAQPIKSLFPGFKSYTWYTLNIGEVK